MPIYEYQCKACGHTFDTIQSFSEAPLTDCPVCKESALKKLVSASAFHLKGSGWYVTDFKNPPTKKEDSAEKNKTEKENTNKPAEANKEAGAKEAGSKSKDTIAEKPVDKTSKTDKSDGKSS